MPVPPRPGTATTRAGGPVAAVGRCPLAGVEEHLAVAHRSGRQAIAGPLGGHGLHRPAEAMGGGLDGAIGTTGTTVEQQLHQPAGGGGAEGGGDREGGANQDHGRHQLPPPGRDNGSEAKGEAWADQGAGEAVAVGPHLRPLEGANPWQSVRRKSRVGCRRSDCVAELLTTT
jgi:hypothetical protein